MSADQIFFNFTDKYILIAKTLRYQTKMPIFCIKDQFKKIMLSVKSQLLKN